MSIALSDSEKVHSGWKIEQSKTYNRNKTIEREKKKIFHYSEENVAHTITFFPLNVTFSFSEFSSVALASDWNLKF